MRKCAFLSFLAILPAPGLNSTTIYKPFYFDVKKKAQTGVIPSGEEQKCGILSNRTTPKATVVFRCGAPRYVLRCGTPNNI